MKRHYIAIIEVESDNFDSTTGPRFVSAIKALQEATKPAGECAVYQVNDHKTMTKWRKELRRANNL